MRRRRREEDEIDDEGFDDVEDDNGDDDDDDDSCGDVHLALLLPPALPHHVVHKAGQSAMLKKKLQ